MNCTGEVHMQLIDGSLKRLANRALTVKFKGIMILEA
jgi:hypothetical protein